jgi:hypothetical protein
MKKIILFGFSLLVFAQINAQTKITKTNVIGKWTIQAVDMPGMIYYNLEKDSLAIGETLKSQMTDPNQLTAVTGMIKPQLAVFSKVGFQFNADGTVELNSGMEGPQSGTYTVDEEKSEITTTEKDAKQNTFKADLLKDNLRVSVKTPQGDMMMILKKAK